ncbi:MAG: class I tRNA ligase family protein, partial [Acidobacteria bacterium]|nr:class I tRNA ligase family protein [Acidobacteriota bacterium]
SGLLPDGSSCPKCGGMEFSKEYDILDVWFDSGSSHLAALGRRKDLPWPADLYIEGGDQYRGWFQSSLLIGVGLRGESPYRASITHGWTLDEQGRAMSKSKGIGIEPADLIRDRGAEIARLLAASVNYVEDIRIFDQLLDRLEEAYRKIRNTCRFLLGNLSNRQDAGHPRFDPARDAVPYERMLEIDRWALARTAQLIQKCLRAYGDYQFHMVYHAVYNFCTVDLSSFYLDVLKDRLYTHGTHSISRRSAQTALWQILDALVRLLAPILPFTAEEAFQAMYEGLDSGKRPESVHMLLFPVYQDSHADPALLQEWDEILSLREVVLRALEEVRQQGVIGNALEARVVIRAGSEKARVLEHRAAELRYIFIVSQAALAVDAGLGPEEIRVEVAAAEGEKCERCWNYSPQVRRDADFPTLCERCAPVVREMRRADPMDSAQ